MLNLSSGTIMEPAFVDGMPNDVLIVEDDPISLLCCCPMLRSKRTPLR